MVSLERVGPMPLTFVIFLVAERREPSGFVAPSGDAPDGLRHSASKVSGFGRWLSDLLIVLEIADPMSAVSEM